MDRTIHRFQSQLRDSSTSLPAQGYTAQSLQADSGLLAVAEADGLVRLEDVTEAEASCPELARDSLPGSCTGCLVF